MLQNKKLSTKLWALVGTSLLVISVIVLFSVYSVIGAKTNVSNMEKDSVVINLAGAQRMLTQKISKQVEWVNSGQLEYLDALNNDITRFDTVLSGLLHGDNTLQLVASPNETIATELQKTQTQWKEFKSQTTIFIESSTQIAHAIEYIIKNNVSLFKSANDAVMTLGKNREPPQTIASARRLRALSQRTTKAAILLHNGDSNSLQELTTFSKMYGSLLTDLLNGSATIRKVKDPAGYAQLISLQKEQLPFLQALSTIETNVPTKNIALNFIRTQNTPLLKQMNTSVQAWANYSHFNVLSLVERLEESLWFQIIIALSGSIGFSILAFMIIKLTTRSLTLVIDKLQSGSDEVTNASSHIAGSSQTLAESASTQASGIEEISASLTETSSMTNQNADTSREANTLSLKTKDITNSGLTAMETMVKAVNEIKSSSNETSKIVKNINEIAFQTNLLALNAAVEAARAGEAGKGFAVVAEEVRNLAQRSAKSANDTADLIDQSITRADQGVNASNEVQKILETIAHSVDNISTLIADVTAASNEQSQGIKQINEGMSLMESSIQSNAATAEESASASEELSAQAEVLNEMVYDLTSIVYGASTNRVLKSHQTITKHTPAPQLLSSTKASQVGSSHQTMNEVEQDNLMQF